MVAPFVLCHTFTLANLRMVITPFLAPACLIAIFVLTHLSAALAHDCFYPDGNIPKDFTFLPCGPENGPHSACCGKGHGCSMNGFCFGNAGFMYRGGCTDRNWTAPACAQHFQNGNAHSYEATQSSAQAFCPVFFLFFFFLFSFYSLFFFFSFFGV